MQTNQTPTQIIPPSEWIRRLHPSISDRHGTKYAMISAKDVEDIQLNVTQYFHDKYGYTYETKT